MQRHCSRHVLLARVELRENKQQTKEVDGTIKSLLSYLRTAYWYLTVICTLFKLMTTKQETWKTYAYFTWVTRNKNLRDANGSC